MQLHNIKSDTNNKTKKRVGRGGKRGCYSGRGLKGQKARAGRKIRPQLRDIIKRLPKKRGYRFKSIKEQAAAVNLSLIEKNFENGDKVTPETLVEKKLVSSARGKAPRVKILGLGELTKKIEISGCEASDSSKEKIKKAGGSIK